MNFGMASYASVAQMSGEAASAGDLTTHRCEVSARGVSRAGNEKQQAEMLKLKKAATQFEAMLLEKWWSSMKKSGFGEEDDGDPGRGTLDSMGMQAMSTAIAGAGGIGIAAMLVRSLQGEIAASDGVNEAAAGASGSLETNRKSR